jgi:uncharacterized protein (DUF2062 family)
MGLRKAIHALGRQMLAEHREPGKLGWAVGVGLFIGTLPLYGLHLPICLGVAHLSKLNKVTLYLAANISNPLIAPLLVAAGIAIGELIRFGHWRGVDLDQGSDFLEKLALFSWELPDLFLSCLLGDAVLGAALGIAIGPIVYFWAKRRRERAEASQA